MFKQDCGVGIQIIKSSDSWIFKSSTPEAQKKVKLRLRNKTY